MKLFFRKIKKYKIFKQLLNVNKKIEVIRTKIWDYKVKIQETLLNKI